MNYDKFTQQFESFKHLLDAKGFQADIFFAAQQMKSVAMLVQQTKAQKDEPIHIPKLKLGEVVQPQKLKVAPKGDYETDGVRVIQRGWEVFVPIELESFDGTMFGGENGYEDLSLFSKKAPAGDPSALKGFKRMVNEIRKSIIIDREEKIFYNGKYVKRTDKNPYPAVDTVDGIKEIADSLLNVQQKIPTANVNIMGVLPTDPDPVKQARLIIKYMKDVCKTVPYKIRQTFSGENQLLKWNILMNPEDLERINDAYDTLSIEDRIKYPDNNTVKGYPQFTMVGIIGKNDHTMEIVIAPQKSDSPFGSQWVAGLLHIVGNVSAMENMNPLQLEAKYVHVLSNWDACFTFTYPENTYLIR